MCPLSCRHSLGQVAACAIGANLKEGGLLTGVPTMFCYEFMPTWPFVLVTGSAGGRGCYLQLLVTVSSAKFFFLRSSLIADS